MGAHRLTEKIPEYLRPYIVHQDASLYTPIDHASWRFILKLSKAFFARHAHQKYLDGLGETGISSERIPLVEEIDAKLKRFGWRAVAVSGFIPPQVFMEFQSLGILPIACDMRKLENLAYTPAPDIVHEAAGHAPIIADPEYADYLRSYGEISRRAIMSSQDMDVYYAIRALSEIKEDPLSTSAEIASAQSKLDDAVAAVDHVSEATLLSRMGWWTFEYGLVGDVSRPKIYGAGLLSSVGESYHCLSSSVRKIPFSVACIEQTYDITKPQPQLFVARDFQHLKEGLQELAEMMAFRRGGIEGLEKAQRAATTTTTVLDSGLQISGTLASFETNAHGEPVFLKFSGPVQLAREDREIPGQGADYHRDGYSTPLGAAGLTRESLESMGFLDGTPGRMELPAGFTLEGVLKEIVAPQGTPLIVTFTDCTVRRGEKIYYRPEWGPFDLACGTKIVAVFGGAADRARYLATTGGFRQPPGKQKTNLTDENRALNALYAQVREFRESENPQAHLPQLAQVQERLARDFPDDWLLRYELLELKTGAAWESELRKALTRISGTSKDRAEMIQRGLELL